MLVETDLEKLEGDTRLYWDVTRRLRQPHDDKERAACIRALGWLVAYAKTQRISRLAQREIKRLAKEGSPIAA